MATIPQHRLGIALTDDDLKALGAVVACWAHSESIMRGVLTFFHAHPSVAATIVPTEDIYSFKGKRKNWNKTVRLVCAGSPVFLELGIFLSVRGNDLQDVRDKACHWAGTRAVKGPDEQVHFTNFATAETAALTTAALWAAAKDIHEWGAMLGMYGVLIGFDLMPPSLDTRSGERPPYMSEALLRYRSRYPNVDFASH
jgi:hypothetical protein